jgi:hypothetical protein
MRLSSREHCGSKATATLDDWLSNWNARVVPLSEVQVAILRVIAGHRQPDSYVAGATPLNRDTPRFSQDVDLFHDREERVAEAAEADAAALRAAGYTVTWLRRVPGVFSAEVAKDGAGTRFEWVVDSDYRFFPTLKDETFGFVLHPIDLAINKVMAAAGRREVRDIVDLAAIHETILPLGALIWAAVEKSPGFTPEGLIAEIRRNLNHPLSEWRNLAASEKIDPGLILKKVRSALDAAEEFTRHMPTELMGLLFLENGRVVQPEPDRLGEYQVHSGHRGGQWPSNPEIAQAMIERYSAPKPKV